MTRESAQDVAERLVRRRARIVPVMAMLFLSGQIVYFSDVAQPLRAVDITRIAAWLFWAVALLVLLATGGGYFRSKAVRDLINDETTRDHRRQGLALGFWAAMLGCALLYVISAFEPVTARESIHLVLTLGVGAALLRFGFLERRALHGG